MELDGSIEADAVAACDFDDALLDDPILRTDAIGSLASIVSAHPLVRAALFHRQKRFAYQPGGAVLDGRDIGTVIATDADAKLGGIPRRQAAVWGKHRFAIAGLPGFSVGAGLRFMGAFTDESSSPSGPRVPSVALLDLMVAYDSEHWRYALNISNVTDRTFITACPYRCFYGEPRKAIVSASYRW